MKDARLINDSNRIHALIRAAELKKAALPYLKSNVHVETGMANAEIIQRRKEEICRILGGSEQEWNNWKWQMKNRIRQPKILAKILGLSKVEEKQVEKVGKVYRWAISPYYLSLIGPDYKTSPIFYQAVPDIKELAGDGSLDPMNEAGTSPAPCITRRYPDRLIINVTNQCAMFCRHCQRRRNIGEADRHAPLKELFKALEYISEHREIRDVLITGGDALLLNDAILDMLLTELDRIPHVEIKRIGTRAPVTLPQRITPELCAILQKHPPVYINTQFNHPMEITPESKKACDMLVEAGVVLGNQAVLLKGINDNPDVMKKLNHELLKIRVRPYYIFHAKNVKGTTHFRTTIQKGLEIMENLRGYTSGLAVPTFIVNAPGGLGKIPVMPQYVVNISNEKAVLRTWEGKIVEIPEPREES